MSLDTDNNKKKSNRKIKSKFKLSKILENSTLQMLIGGVVIYMSFVGVILATIQIPPDAILDSGLKEIIMVFED